jgi:hypothetical protein
MAEGHGPEIIVVQSGKSRRVSVFGILIFGRKEETGLSFTVEMMLLF